MKLAEQIERTATELRATLPRSQRRIELEFRLKHLIARQLRAEIRAERKAA
jgi:hypothetical protein